VFAIIGKVCNTLKKAGHKKQAEEFQARAFSAGSYSDVLCMLSDYVTVK